MSLACFITSLVLCTASWSQEPPEESSLPFDLDAAVEESIGTFDEKGRLHNETESTLRFPDIGVWAAYFPQTHDLSTGLSIELRDRRRWKLDAVLGEQRAGFSFGRKLVPVIDFTVSVYWTRDFDRDDNVWGFGLSLVKF